MKHSLLAVAVLSIVQIVPCSVYADEARGKPSMIFADPSDVVVVLDVQFSFFHIQRTNTNFKELTAVALTAFATGKTLLFL